MQDDKVEGYLVNVNESEKLAKYQNFARPLREIWIIV